MENFKDTEQRKKQEKELKKEQTLYDSLVTYGKSDFYPYHMPGHKRKGNGSLLSDAFRMDITEIDGFDNLHCAKGILKEAQERAARLYGAEESFFLVNGSTCGVLAAVMAVTDKQDTVLVARNCHKSVYHAAYLQELHLRYLYPGEIAEYGIFDAVNPEDVETALENYPECKAVVVTSPTYEGIVSDIGEISRIVHGKGKILIVDEAHGAHFGWAEGMPENAVRQGADLVVHSLHKTLPSMTQTALLHVVGDRVNRMKLRSYLNILQSSSPSYVLMASMDACLSYMEKNAVSSFAKLKQCYKRFMEQTENCRYIHIGNLITVRDKGYQLAAWDICKLVISVKGASISGQALYDLFREEFHLQLEMAAVSYVLAIMTIADADVDWKRLADAIVKIDGRIVNGGIKNDGVENSEIKNDRTEAEEARRAESGKKENQEYPRPAAKMSVAQAFYELYNDNYSDAESSLNAEGSLDVCRGKKEVPLTEAQGKIIGEFINLYPPGIPILVPGEIVDKETILQIQKSLESGLRVQGVSERGTVVIL